MPVDTHIFRVSRRLGLMAQDTDIEEAHRVLTELVSESAHPGRRRDAGAVRSAKDLIYRFHLGIIEHGRKTCKAVNPGCGRCVLYGLCRFEDKAEYRKRGRL
jgi:endonuclease-3